MYRLMARLFLNILIAFCFMSCFSGGHAIARDADTSYRQGNIYEKNSDSIIIDDMEYRLRPDIKLLDETGSTTEIEGFHKGNFVGYRLDPEGRIAELRMIGAEQNAEQLSGYSEAIKEEMGNKVYQENGVWKNH